MQKSMSRKGLVFGIFVMFIGASGIPSTIGIIEEESTFLNSKSGGYIQDLIDNATDGDTINIPSGTYYENIIINKSISLFGEDKNTTIIDGGGNGSVVRISVDNVTVSGFTIQKCGNRSDDAGVSVLFFSNGNTIKGNNIFFNSNDGIRIINEGDRRNRNVIKDNTIKFNNEDGICIFGSDYNKILGNTIEFNNDTGINIYGWPWGYPIPSPGEDSSFNIVKGNTITNNKNGIYICHSGFNFIRKNNFIDNWQDAFFESSHFNRWIRNYWNEPRNVPKIILGQIEFGQGDFFPWINFDWFPARAQYDI